jgi:hypothetical protein
MILLHDFDIDLRSYAKKGTNNLFPAIVYCPSCKNQNCLKRHGFYHRYAVEGKETFKIPICRYKCPHCQITISILPSFLIPFFQHTALVIVTSIYNRLISKETRLISRQLIAFYIQRFTYQSSWIFSFLLTFQDEFTYRPHTPILLMKKIFKIGLLNFNILSFGYQSSYFMSPQPLLSVEST